MIRTHLNTLRYYYENYTESHKLFKEFFYLRRFSIKRSWKTSRIRKHENRHFRSSLTTQCDVLYTAESAVCMSLQFLLKGQSGEILSEVNTSIMKEKKNFFDLLNLKLWFRGVMNTAE